MKLTFRAILALFTVALFSAFVKAAPLVTETPVDDVDAATVVSVGTFTWTRVPDTAPTSLTALMVTNDPNNTANVLGMFTTSTTTPSLSTATFSMCFKPGATATLGINPKVYLWLVNWGSAAANVGVQPVRQQ